MKLQITINMNNAAFFDDDAEVARILIKVAHQIENGTKEGIIKDINGNTVGGFSIAE